MCGKAGERKGGREGVREEEREGEREVGIFTSCIYFPVIFSPLMGNMLVLKALHHLPCIACCHLTHMHIKY